MNKARFNAPRVGTRFLRFGVWLSLVCVALLTEKGFCRDVPYEGQEVEIFVDANEPTQVNFPGEIAGGYMKTDSSVQLQRQGADLILFAQGSLTEEGEAIIVRLKDGRSFSVRIKVANELNPRDANVKIEDISQPVLSEDEELEEGAPYKTKEFKQAPPTIVSGFMRELMLHAEFAKPKIQGYRVNEQYRGQTVLNDGTMVTTIDKILIGQRFWGYVLDAENLLDTAQRINPGTFRIDGTRAVSASNWDLAPRPITTEQKIAGKHKAKIYIITRSKK